MMSWFLACLLLATSCFVACAAQSPSASTTTIAAALPQSASRTNSTIPTKTIAATAILEAGKLFTCNRTAYLPARWVLGTLVEIELHCNNLANERIKQIDINLSGNFTEAFHLQSVKESVITLELKDGTFAYSVFEVVINASFQGSTVMDSVLIPVSINQDTPIIVSLSFNYSIPETASSGYSMVFFGGTVNEIAFRITTAQPAESAQFFSLRQIGIVAIISLKTSLQNIPVNLISLTLEARDTTTGRYSTAIIWITVLRAQHYYCLSTSVSRTVLSNITQTVVVDVSCYTSDSGSLTYSIVQHAENVNISLDARNLQVLLHPPIPRGVASDRITINVTDGSQNTTIDFKFEITRVPPTPVLRLKKMTTRETIFDVEIGSYIHELADWVNSDVIQYHFLEMNREGRPVVVETWADTVANEPSTIRYTVFGLSEEVMYSSRFTTVGSDMNVKSPEIFFKMGGRDHPYADDPYVTSSEPSIIKVGTEMTLSCIHFEDIYILSLRWFHNNSVVKVKDESSHQLKLFTSFTDSGYYRCEIRNTFGGNRSSADFVLTVKNIDEIYNYTINQEVSWQRPWMPELAKTSSPLFAVTKHYVKTLLFSMKPDRPNLCCAEVFSFREGSVIANISVTERVLQPGDTTDIGQFLQRKLRNNGTGVILQDSLGIMKMSRTIPSSLPILEGRLLEIVCHVVLLQRLKDPQIEVLWLLDGSAINPLQSQTFAFKDVVTVFTNTSSGLNIGNMMIYFHELSLQVNKFPPRLTGEYTCIVRKPASAMEEKMSVTILPGDVQRIPQIVINALSVQIPIGSNVTVSCKHFNADVIHVKDGAHRVLHTFNSSGQDGMVIHKLISPSNSSVFCEATNNNFPEIRIRSELLIITVHDAGIEQCPESEDRLGTKWETIPAGTEAKQACVEIYDGYVTRACSNEGEWMPSNYIGCVRTEWIELIEEINKVQTDGLEVSKDFISKVVSSLTKSMNDSHQIVSGDIQQFAEFVSKLGELVSAENISMVDSETVNNLATVTNRAFSSSDAEWEDVKKDEVNRKKPNSGVLLIVAMDRIMLSSIKDPKTSSDPIIRSKLAIKQDSLYLEDIQFPNRTEKNYQHFDGWVLSSENQFFLAKEAFSHQHKQVAYSVILYRDVKTKLSVDPTRQNKYRDGQAFRDKEILSDVISFVLSEDISALSPPLVLRFQFSKENYTDPLCGFLDTKADFEKIGVWSSKGCKTQTLNSGLIQCKCNHLTNFAVLMSPSGAAKGEHHRILTIITYVGCGISLLCLLITLAVHSIVWKYIQSERSSLHLQLCFCLILAYFAFLAGINRTENKVVCMVVAGVLHYLFLLVFFLMLAEGILVLVSVTMVFHRRKILRELLFFTYGAPLVIVGISLGVTQTDGYRSERFCWLNATSGFLWAFVGPALVVIVVNLIAVILAIKALLKTTVRISSDVASRAKSMIRAIVVLSPILGLTWAFGVLSVHQDLVEFQYLFAVCNTLQGLFIFLFHCVFSQQVKDGFQKMMKKHESMQLSSLPLPKFENSPPKPSMSSEETQKDSKTMMGSNETPTQLVSGSSSSRQDESKSPLQSLGSSQQSAASSQQSAASSQKTYKDFLDEQQSKITYASGCVKKKRKNEKKRKGDTNKYSDPSNHGAEISLQRSNTPHLSQPQQPPILYAGGHRSNVFKTGHTDPAYFQYGAYISPQRSNTPHFWHPRQERIFFEDGNNPHEYEPISAVNPHHYYDQGLYY